MPTLRDVCRDLGVSYHTLKKWLGKLDLTATKHPYDDRYYVLDDEAVERLRAARAQRPGALSMVPAPPPALPRPAFLTDTLPADWLPFSRWCATHNVNPLSARRATQDGFLPAPYTRARGAGWRSGQQEVLSAYDAEQHRAASAYAAVRWLARFHACPACAPADPLGARTHET
jgi:hypothetical protein